MFWRTIHSPANQPAVLSDRAQLLDGCALECAVRLWLASRQSALFWCEAEAVRSLQSALIRIFREIRALFGKFGARCEDILCGPDWVAEREGFEPSIQLRGSKRRRVRSLHPVNPWREN
jgi:hypothetical protein